MDMNSDADRTALAVALIGFGLLFTPLARLVGGFWPGILFVFAAAVIARGVAEGEPWYKITPALWLIGLGLVFLFGFSLPLLLIVVGVTMLFGYSYRPKMFGGYHHDEFYHDQPEHDEFV